MTFKNFTHTLHTKERHSPTIWPLIVRSFRAPDTAKLSPTATNSSDVLRRKISADFFPENMCKFPQRYRGIEIDGGAARQAAGRAELPMQ